MSIIFHADDFGVTPDQSARILDCADNGALNSLSIFAGSSDFDECMKLLKGRDLRFCAHLNLTEGRPCLPNSSVPLLTDSAGYFHLTFIKLLLKSFAGKNSEFANQVKEELFAQYDKIKKALPEDTPLYVDSHQHIHMIPLIFNTALHFDPPGIRLTCEPLSPFFSQPKQLLSYKTVNWIKTFVLKLLGIIDRPMLKKKKMRAALFFGVLMTGHMDGKRVKKVLPGFIKKADKKHLDVEILFHPGRVSHITGCLNPNNSELCSAQLSPNRDIEHDALIELKNQ